MNNNTVNGNMYTYKSFIILSLFALSWPMTGWSQTAERNDRQSSSTSSTQSTTQANPPQMLMGQVIQDGPVDPKEYIVGPGDIFSVSIWSASPMMYQIPVTPEGSVVIPTVNELMVSGVTLESAKKMVLNEIRKKYITGNATFTLLTPRSFTITVLGAVLNEGTVIVKSTQRVDAAIVLANDVQKYRELTGANTLDPKQLKEISKKLTSSSKRNIIVKRKNGTVIKADIDKYFASLNTKFNPLLLDGDIVFVQPKNIDKDFVGIYGAVSKEGNYEFVEGDSVSGLLRMGGGLTAMADGGKAILYRMTESGSQENIELNLHAIMANRSPDMLLYRGDRLIVQNKSVIERGGVVTIEGEVVMPGSYPIIRDSTTLSQIVAMAGGLTTYASLQSSIVMRPKKSEQVTIDSVQLKRGLTSLENTEYLLHEISINSLFSPVQADFVSLFEKGDNTKDIKMLDGDKIIITSKINAVYVFGEVKNPGFIPFKPGKNAEYYITQSGGITTHAELEDMRVIKASSKQWLIPGETSLEEGDYLWIPKEPYRPFGYYLSVYSQVFGIVGTVATLFILVVR